MTAWTPPMGWNSWDCYGAAVTEDAVRKNAAYMAEKLKPFDDYDEKLAEAQEYDRVSRDKNADASQLKMGAAEFNEFVKEMNHYQDLISKALKDEMEKDVEVEFEPIGEDALLKLMNSNDWTMAEVMAVSEVAVE